MLVPESTDLSCLEDLFQNVKREIILLNKDSAKKHNPYNLNAIRSNKGRVMVKWNEDNKTKGWKPGWYTANIKKYIKVFDIIEIEYTQVKVKESVENGTLRLHNTPCVVQDLYDKVTEIGESIFIKWDQSELEQSGWKPGWYLAEVQAFDPGRDEIRIIYRKEPTVIYTECVSQLIAAGKVKTKCKTQV